MTLYLNIGSNIGDRRSNLLRAVALIKRLPWLYPGTLRISDFIESEPWGFSSDNTFINVGVAVDIHTGISPIHILDSLLAVQNQINPDTHRDNLGNYIDRVIDIDIIAIDRLVYSHPRLTIPHPRMHLREFVLKPMRQLAPEWQHPLIKQP
ncbi:MAG: 2-amino-4-hydroxy-6-hydroxymethyldihydropteridine diphosphokinase [Muribaculaceae bacterium]|nr:2-amino-4-hydroxy-6-hydroxymethyldihydropteridine diphosphokinase [Muribaculaceae bacterium]